VLGQKYLMSRSVLTAMMTAATATATHAHQISTLTMLQVRCACAVCTTTIAPVHGASTNAPLAPLFDGLGELLVEFAGPDGHVVLVERVFHDEVPV